jgi:predicted Zn-dependent protease
LAEQWARRTEVPRRLACYLTVREMRHLVDEGKLDAAIKLGRKEQHDQPSLVLGVALADLLLGKGDKDGAARALGFAPHLTAVQSNEWTVLVAAADMLMRAGKASAALQVYENLFARRDLPDNLRLVWLREAVKAANTDHDMSRCIRWEQEAARLSVSQ